MRLDLSTWQEVEAYLTRKRGILLPTGSIEQHGPMGLIGTDALCAEAIATGAAEASGVFVAPCVAYAPAPFNTAFPGTISISAQTFTALLRDILNGLHAQGFTRIYVLNGHGANLAPLKTVAAEFPPDDIRIHSWWDFEPVNKLRRELYGDWEGMHATPSEVSITQTLHRIVPHGDAESPPQKLSAAYIADHSGDRHSPPDAHRATFPDGRVGSHSALARPEHGSALLAAAIQALSQDFTDFSA